MFVCAFLWVVCLCVCVCESECFPFALCVCARVRATCRIKRTKQEANPQNPSASLPEQVSSEAKGDCTPSHFSVSQSHHLRGARNALPPKSVGIGMRFKKVHGKNLAG